MISTDSTEIFHQIKVSRTLIRTNRCHHRDVGLRVMGRDAEPLGGLEEDPGDDLRSVPLGSSLSLAGSVNNICWVNIKEETGSARQGHQEQEMDEVRETQFGICSTITLGTITKSPHCPEQNKTTMKHRVITVV